jgi:hypothetical protein
MFKKSKILRIEKYCSVYQIFLLDIVDDIEWQNQSEIMSC